MGADLDYNRTNGWSTCGMLGENGKVPRGPVKGHHVAPYL